MNKINIKFFVLLLIFVTFFIGCSKLVGDVADSSSFAKKEIVNNINNSKQNDAKMARDIQISFFLVDSQIVLHQPVLLKFVIENGLEEPINLDLGENFKEGFLFTIVFPDGRRSRLPQLTSEGISRIGRVLLKPQQTYSQEILVNEWTEFSMAGNYVLEGQLANSVKTEDGKIVTIDSNFSLALEVEPENAEDLKKVCDGIFKRLIETRSYAEAAEAALTLSYVKDPVAVPYLQKVLTSNKMVESVIINSLREQGGKVSVEVLIGAINVKPNSNMAVRAKSALNWIDAHTSDAAVKARIIQALNYEQK